MRHSLPPRRGRLCRTNHDHGCLRQREPDRAVVWREAPFDLKRASPRSHALGADPSVLLGACTGMSKAEKSRKAAERVRVLGYLRRRAAENPSRWPISIKFLAPIVRVPERRIASILRYTNEISDRSGNGWDKKNERLGEGEGGKEITKWTFITFLSVDMHCPAKTMATFLAKFADPSGPTALAGPLLLARPRANRQRSRLAHLRPPRSSLQMPSLGDGAAAQSGSTS